MAFKIVFTFLLISCIFFDTGSAYRSLGVANMDLASLKTMLDGSGSGSASYWDCWNALMAIRSCSNEIVGFFLDGKTDIGESCCSSITTITHNCWPNMLATLGFTAEEGNLLSGFCDKGVVPVPANAPDAAPPAQSLDVTVSGVVGV